MARKNSNRRSPLDYADPFLRRAIDPTPEQLAAMNTPEAREALLRLRTSVEGALESIDAGMIDDAVAHWAFGAVAAQEVGVRWADPLPVPPRTRSAR